MICKNNGNIEITMGGDVDEKLKTLGFKKNIWIFYAIWTFFMVSKTKKHGFATFFVVTWHLLNKTSTWNHFQHPNFNVFWTHWFFLTWKISLFNFNDENVNFKYEIQWYTKYLKNNHLKKWSRLNNVFNHFILSLKLNILVAKCIELMDDW